MRARSRRSWRAPSGSLFPSSNKRRGRKARPLSGAASLATPLASKGRAGLLFIQSEAQHGLGQNVALDLVGAAVDRHLAIVEVARGCGSGPIEVERGLVGAKLRVFLLWLVGQGQGSCDLEHQFGRALLDLAAFDLENGGLGVGQPVLAVP